MTTTPVSPGAGNTPDNNVDVTSGNTLDVQNGGTANSTTVESGGTLQVDAGGTESGALIKAGGTETVTGTINGSNAVTSAATAGSDDDFGTINVGSGGVISNVTVENGAFLNLTAKSASANTVTVASGGSLTINGNAPANNVTLQGGTLELMSPKADTTNTTTGVPSATGSLTFASGYQSKLQIDVAQTGTNGTTFAQTINGFASGDNVDLRAQTFAGATFTATQNGTSTNVTVTGGSSSGSESFTFANTTASSFSIIGDGNGTTPGTDIAYAVCYVSGTRIRTARGDVAVEDLVVGDLAVTVSGEDRPIRWIGHRRTICRNRERPHEINPVRISAHAFGDARPARDLHISPGHSICVDMLGEVLIPASTLINGTTIRQVDVEEVTYWHIELDSHDILIAENLPAESYLEMGNRGFFDESSVVDLHALPDAPVRTHADFCRPFHADGALVDAVRMQLQRRVTALGWTLDDSDTLGDLHLVADGVRIERVTRGLVARFTVPAGARDVWLVSETSRPCEISNSSDRRDLGVCVVGLTIEDGFTPSHRIELTDPMLCIGFHDLEEGAWRWTTGRGLIPAALWEGQLDGFFLCIELGGPALPRWVAPQSVETGRGSPLLALIDDCA